MPDSSCNRPPIVFAHGFGGGSTMFMTNPPESSPAFILADAGFDVFLLNHRGTTYGRRHKFLKQWENKFWQYTVDDMSKYDSTAVIDKVLELTGNEGIYWIGLSQGTTMAYLTLADHPEYNSKIKALFQTGPAGTAGYAQGPIKIALWAYKALKPVVDFYRIAIGSHEVAFQWPSVFRPLVRLCNIIPMAPQICNSAINLLMGPSTRTINMTRAPVYLAHTPSGTSTMSALHLAQIASRLKFEHMDHNPAENLRRYGQLTPPLYDFSNIDVPVYHIRGTADILASEEDVKNTESLLKKGVVKGSFRIEGYNHIDYSFATDCAEMVYNPITAIVRKQEPDMCQR
ncbi:hypothetical protein PRIPAC_79232 [Pristionchus pacificus]|uniref:Hydrolase n=1 Tax=Pristionchus pacificus TaxID=54126 RepID=A0A454XL09_PRIPA|nr:hypothetical protein PRIPAC_79232 [Pristionchus pacificus]|eukprot:PDM72123.1 hydrolase [Pristionchus pacificus]